MTKRFLVTFSNVSTANASNLDQNLALDVARQNGQSGLTHKTHQVFKNFARGCVGILACLSLAAVRLPVQAQMTSVSDDEVTRYAKAVLAIEGKRRQIYADAKGLPEWNSVSQKASSKGVNVCDLSQAELPGNIYSLCQQLFKASQTEVSRYGFDNSTFNRITQAQQRDRQLQQRIQTQMVQINNSR
jgi:hypothetical protein